MAGAMDWVKIIHGRLIQPQVNAWHYWWFITTKSTGEGLLNAANETYTTTKRLWTLGN